MKVIEININFVTENQEDGVGIWFSSHALDKTYTEFIGVLLGTLVLYMKFQTAQMLRDLGRLDRSGP